MFVQVTIDTDERSDVPVVPREAITQRDGQPTVFVVGADDRLALRPVQLGVADRERTEIVGGLVPGELVVVSGPDGLREGQQVSPRSR
jgi:multidrug efflux pump subunit AcrA (membrane-fusion protein)